MSATPQQMINAWSRLVAADRILEKGFDKTIRSDVQRMHQLDALARKGLPKTYGKREMEQDIWVLWIASLDPKNEDSHDILDLDAIEDHLHYKIGVLGEGSVLGVNFGRYTSEADERAAIYAARAKKATILARFKQLSGG